MTLIDLGELTEQTDPPVSRRRSGPGGRRLAIVVVALVALLTLAGGAPPAGRIHAIVPAALGSDLFIAAGLVFTVSPVPEATDGSQELLAYPRPDRPTDAPQRLTPLWRVPVPLGNRVYRVHPVADAGVLVAMGRQDAGTSQTLRLDAHTGEERWRVPGIAVLDLPGRALLRTFTDSEPNVLRVIELADAREVWSMSLSAASVDYRQRDDGTLDGIVVATVDGEVQVIDPTTGTVRHRLAPSADHASGYQQAWVTGDLVTVVRNSSSITALSVDGLAQRWQVTVPTATYVTGCGPLLCAGLAGGGLQVLDPATGALRWSSDDILDLVLVDEHNVLAVARNTNEMLTLDLDTGATLTEHGSWNMVARYEYTPQVLVVRPVAEVGLVLARLDPTGAPARRLDLLPDAGGDCQSRYDLLGCRLRDGGYGIWQLPD
ncbi:MULTISPECIES: PQQ-binding-like beta-propeller repeat protein [unclassified Micromonospora]|uniref:outer membrane protein assembly factor BamB family protein n=1 Tax=unclassified Micromonospora TaxID=2617518 RepID=UPI0022B702EC|nr:MULTISPECIES: PQQ-binding-like beta-propeller repeat protein [unclassified Micromonospora]MCZ7420182.1 PQQ-binding-like beta-propeller repeat protein [Verrucosispora sp. WMMA2121]WBB89303.1 PQQ-binding-like beta-propeller repeat protein [Verrucosispora sp. WMMC514]